MAVSKRRAKFSKAIKNHLQEYIDEAEHQDGVEYWDRSLKDLVEDFSVYLKELADVDHSDETDKAVIEQRREDYSGKFVIRRIRSNPRAKFKYWDNHMKVWTTELAEASKYNTQGLAEVVRRDRKLTGVLIEKI